MEANKGDLRKAVRNFGFNYQAAALRLGLVPVSHEYTLGHPELRKYIIAYRHVFRDWPKTSQEVLRDARQKFDAGTHEMCQGRDGDYIIQYLIPRLKPCKERGFFRASV